MPETLILIVDKFKMQSFAVFYGTVLAVVLSLSAAIETLSSGGSFKPIDLPYIEAKAHGAPTRPLQISSATAAAAIAPVLPAAPDDGTSIWPLHGIVTTEFGASDYPYQTHHTGIDISSAHPSGAMPIHAFRAGTVISVIHASTSFGNHVIIDHGGGLTSLYGHMYSTSVSVGQQVHAGDTLGTEGSTGASTGPHLHFEVRQDGVPQNPRRYVPGTPNQ